MPPGSCDRRDSRRRCSGLAIRDRVLEFWTGPAYFAEFEARTESEAYRKRGVPLMRGRYRRCASQQGNALRSVIALGIEDDRVDALVERLLRWQWPDGGWNCDRKPDADTSSFHETWLPTIGLAACGGGVPQASAIQASLRRQGHQRRFRRAPLPALLALRRARRSRRGAGGREDP